MKHAKLMVLGASVAQLPMIRKAVALGHYVITVDNRPDNIGHQFSHQAVNCSTVDRHGVLQIAKSLKIDGIVTFASDVATVTVAFVAEHLRLAGCPVNVAETMSNKASFRQFQRIRNLACPRFIITKSLAEWNYKKSELIPPLLFKPVDTSGSRGITKVSELDVGVCQQAFSYAQGFARSGVVSIETFVEGVDVSGDGFLLAGELAAIATQKYQQGFVPTGHRLPTQLSPTDQARVFKEVAKTCKALGYHNGPLDFDVKISEAQVTVIEISPRLGGNGIPELILRSTGVDLIELTIQYALGSFYQLPAGMDVKQPCGSWVFGSAVAGQLAEIASAGGLRASVPQVFEYAINYCLGDNVPYFEHSGNCIGYVLFDCFAEDDYAMVVERVRTALQLHVVANA